MKIALDAAGGDHGAKEMVAGAIAALENYDYLEKIYLVGKNKEIEPLLVKFHDKLEIITADELIEMGDHPATAYRRKKNASITVATRLVKEGVADAVVSAGSTGGQMVAALFGLGRIKGVGRPAIGCVIPTANGGKLLVDAGANTSVNEENLVQFAQMGSIYMRSIMGIASPRVGLINNGSEESKGSELTQKAYQALKNTPSINFIGNIEGREIPLGIADVMTCDGFTGNIVLKTMEGMGKTIINMLTEEVMKSTKAKLGAVLMKPALKNLKAKMDYAEYGGAPLLGIDGISIICHGSSKAPAIKNAIRVAYECYQKDFVEQIKANLKTETQP